MDSRDRRIRRALWTLPFAQYGLAAAGVAVATALRFPLESYLHGRSPFALYYLPILLTAWYFGVGPTILATVLSLASALVFFVPIHEEGYAASSVLFLVVSGAMILMAVRGRRKQIFERSAMLASRRAQQASGSAVWDRDLENDPFRPENLPLLLGVDIAADLPLVEADLRKSIHADDLARAVEIVRNTIESGDSQFSVELRVDTPARGLVWLASKGDVFRDRSGRASRMSGITLDITARKSAEELRSFTAAIVESSDDAIIGKNLGGIIQSCNASAVRLFGYSADELIGSPVTMLIPTDRQTEEAEILSRLRKGERVEHFETVRVAKDGRAIDISLTVSPIRGASGEIIGASKIARDITERKRVARALVAQEERFRATLASIGDAVIATDPDGRITFLNGMAETMTGWTLSEAVGRPLADVFRTVNETTRQTVENPTERVFRSGRVAGLTRDTMLIARDGTERPIDDSAAPILDNAGKILGVILVFHDVTERHNAEAALQTALAERDGLLESERAARSEAERANRVKDDFVAMVSHELRTPLNAILGWTQLLLNSASDTATVHRGLEVIARNTRIQSQLIMDLLDISRIVSGKLRLDIQSVNIASIVQDAIETVQHAADAKGIEIRRHLGTTPGVAIGDPARLQQVVWNLLSNAIKFTPKGGRIIVSLQCVESNVEIVVEDTGSGITPDLLPHIFDRFQQGGAPTTRRYGGLGLGLSISKHLVELHGGSVTASSPGEGKGSRFTISLPVMVLSSLKAAGLHDGAVGRALQSDSVSLRSVKVLVVEDEADTRDLVRRLLEDHRAVVVTAASAPEALELLSSAEPHILISDIGLPDIDGYELIRLIRLRGIADGGGIPAVALTAFARSEDRTRALRAGYQAHIAKPVEPAELIATISSFGDLIASRKN